MHDGKGLNAKATEPKHWQCKHHVKVPERYFTLKIIDNKVGQWWHTP